MLLVLALISCSDYQLRRQEPELELSAGSLDFDQVVLGAQRTGTITARNVGLGVLSLDSVTVSGSDDLTLSPLASDQIDPGEELSIAVSYAPSETGVDVGELLIVSNDPTRPELSVPLAGAGVEPSIDVDPETLWFGAVAPGDSATLTVDVNARGEGRLRIDEIAFAAQEADAFTLTLPASVTLPTVLEPGEGFSFDVTFAPADDSPWDGALVIWSTDPDDPGVGVRLLGNTGSTGEAPPEAEITDPDWGGYLISGDSVTLRGVVTDDADDPEDLLVAWYADGSLLGVATPDASGRVTYETDALPEGESVVVRLTALDSTGQSASDEVELSVWPADEPFPYLLTGGNSLFDYWSVDDDVVITLDGDAILVDSDHSQDTHPPLDFEARAGQVLRVMATDYNYCDRQLDALVIHWGPSEHQALNDEICLSACPEHPCYDPEFAGPWPGVFLDQSFTIAIP